MVNNISQIIRTIFGSSNCPVFYSLFPLKSNPKSLISILWMFSLISRFQNFLFLFLYFKILFFNIFLKTLSSLSWFQLVHTGLCARKSFFILPYRNIAWMPDVWFSLFPLNLLGKILKLSFVVMSFIVKVGKKVWYGFATLLRVLFVFPLRPCAF